MIILMEKLNLDKKTVKLVSEFDYFELNIR